MDGNANLKQLLGQILDDISRKTGVDCSRFRKARLCAAGYERSVDNVPIPNPHFVHVPELTSKPWWQKSDFDSDLQGILTEFEDNHEELVNEFSQSVNQ